MNRAQEGHVEMALSLRFYLGCISSRLARRRFSMGLKMPGRKVKLNAYTAINKLSVVLCFVYSIMRHTVSLLIFKVLYIEKHDRHTRQFILEQNKQSIKSSEITFLP